ncbi:MAG: hypothetical protein HFE63_02350 [Clostridiales bacterium]|nr:hypothetical protein [Clostridiales bacterium]
MTEHTKKYIAHAGIHLNGRAAAQNSLESLRLAAKLGFDFVEIDVRLTSDGEVVACHDPTLNSTFVNRDLSPLTSEVQVCEHTLSELRANYILHADEPEKCELIPTLADCAVAARNNNITLMVHPKISSDEMVEAISRICGEILGEHGYYIVSEDKAVRRVLELDPDMPTMAICKNADDIAHFAKYPNCIIAISWKSADYDSLVSEAHRRGRLVETTLNRDIRAYPAADIINYDYLAPHIPDGTFVLDTLINSDYEGFEVKLGVAEVTFELCGQAKLTVGERCFELSAAVPTKYRAAVILCREPCRVTSEGDIVDIQLRVAEI